MKNFKKASKYAKNYNLQMWKWSFLHKKHLQLIEPSWTLSWHLNFLEGWKKCYYFFWSQARRKTFKRNPDLQVSILSLESELQNGIQSTYCTSHFHQERSVFGWSSVVSFPERNSLAHVHCNIFNWLSSMFRPALPFNIAAW